MDTIPEFRASWNCGLRSQEFRRPKIKQFWWNGCLMFDNMYKRRERLESKVNKGFGVGGISRISSQGGCEKESNEQDHQRHAVRGSGV